MHPALLDQPEWKQNQDLQDQLQQREGAWRLESNRRAAEHQAAVAAHQEQAAAAILAGEKPPPPPKEPEPEFDAGPWFRQRKQELERERQQLLRDLAPRVEEAAARREAELFAAVRETPVAELGPLVEELDRLLATVIMVRATLGHGDATHESQVDRTRKHIESAGEVVDFALANRSLLAMRPLPPKPVDPSEPDPLEAARVQDAISGQPATLAGGQPTPNLWAPQSITPDQLAASYPPSHPFRQRAASRDVTQPRPEPAEPEPATS